MKQTTLLAAIAAGANALVAPETVADPLAEALGAAKLSGHVRLRYETVDDDALADEAEGLTLRTRLGIETGEVAGFAVVAEFEDVRTLFGLDDYAPETAGYPVIADPEVTEVNRAYLRYRGIEKLELGLGRQRIIFDNARFVGNVGWRQDEQTFDAFTANYAGLSDLTVNYAYLNKVAGITESFDADVDDHLVNIAYTGLGFGKLTGYGYLLDNEDTNATSDTYGVRFEGAAPMGAVRFLYAAEYASQAAELGAGEFDVDYWLGELGLGFAVGPVAMVAKAGQEMLGSDAGRYGFQTPYATKHAFNGWADKFLVTPAVGLEDRYLLLGADFPLGIKALAVYHRFDAEAGGADFGSEWDVQLTRAFGAAYQVGLKYASYQAEDGPFSDADKFWLWGEFSF